MSDLVVFLRARLDEDEAYARAATEGPWFHDPGKQWLDQDAFEAYDRTKGFEFVGFGGPSPFTGCVAGTGPADHPQSMTDAAFIARHDPVRVLAEVAAKRAIVALHGERDGECMSCAYGGGFSVRYDDHPCDTLRHLAAVYAGHVDYRAEWAPAGVEVEG